MTRVRRGVVLPRVTLCGLPAAIEERRPRFKLTAGVSLMNTSVLSRGLKGKPRPEWAWSFPAVRVTTAAVAGAGPVTEGIKMRNLVPRGLRQLLGSCFVSCCALGEPRHALLLGACAREAAWVWRTDSTALRVFPCLIFSFSSITSLFHFLGLRYRRFHLSSKGTAEVLAGTPGCGLVPPK